MRWRVDHESFGNFTTDSHSELGLLYQATHLSFNWDVSRTHGFKHAAFPDSEVNSSMWIPMYIFFHFSLLTRPLCHCSI